MGNFNSSLWNVVIVVCTMGGIAWMFWLLSWNSKSSEDASEETAFIEPSDAPDGPKSMGHIWDGDLEELNNPLPRWWLNMFYITLVYGVVYILYYPSLGTGTMFGNWSSTAQYEREMAAAEATFGPIYAKYSATPIAELAGDNEAMQIGRRLFSTYCSACHGSDAGGQRGYPNLRDDSWQWGGAPEQIEATIAGGRNAVMPGWTAALGGEAGVKQMVEYVRSLSGLEHDAGAAATAAPKYALCMACHGPEAQGNPALGAPNLADSDWLYGGTPGAIEHTLNNGRNGQMPAFADFLGTAKVRLVAAYVYSLSQP